MPRTVRVLALASALLLTIAIVEGMALRKGRAELQRLHQELHETRSRCGADARL